METVNITHKILDMQPELRRFAYKLTEDHESANDLVQDCVLKALDNQTKYVHSQNFKGWMYTIMRNIFINNYRRSLRQVDMTEDTYKNYLQNLPDDEESTRFEYIYDLKELYKVIHAVPEDLKKPFLMFVAGFKYREIADKMNLPVGTIKSRLFLIRKRLKEDLKDFSQGLIY